jgi:hypothetical protein
MIGRSPVTQVAQRTLVGTETKESGTARRQMSIRIMKNSISDFGASPFHRKPIFLIGGRSCVECKQQSGLCG